MDVAPLKLLFLVLLTYVLANEESRSYVHNNGSSHAPTGAITNMSSIERTDSDNETATNPSAVKPASEDETDAKLPTEKPASEDETDAKLPAEKPASEDEATVMPTTRTNDGAPFESSTMSSDVSKLLGKTFNFSTLLEATDNVQLTLANQTINLSAFTVDEKNVMSLQSISGDESLSDTMYVAAKLAGIEKRIADKLNKTLTTLALEDIFDAEDDMVLTREDVDEMVREINQDTSTLDLSQRHDESEFDSTRRKRKAMEHRQWSTNIPYIISADFNTYASGKKAIEDAIRHWEEETCLNFVKFSRYYGPHLIFKKNKGCSSYIGKRGSGQTISIGTGCDTKGIAAHEIGHALGFWHEQGRPDRDTYVRVYYDNIKSGKSHNFRRESWRNARSMGIPYDYSSVMHYGTKAFSKNERPTITAKESDMETTLGTRSGLSFYDVKIANLIYCSSACPGGLSWSACRHEGYRDPKNCNRCKCPDGLSGTCCTSVKPGKRASCGNRDRYASSVWQTLNSPNYGVSTYPANSECTWRIKVSGSSKRIMMRFKGKFSFSCDSTCKEYVEVRHTDVAKTGPRFCCYTRPTRYFRSHGSEMLILMRADTGYRGDGFALEYKIEPCGGCSSSTSTTGPACLDSQTYTCRGTYSTSCGFWGWGRCTRYRLNTCYRQVKTCCYGFRLSGSWCYRKNANEGRLLTSDILK
ncbi:zinc metalloproteinase dpy-31-like [Haliotis rufescens]|uniref:zinc metalloproteinase dpy-31-like n=1 Tax=Haliotis rufescens TaxID=6454 RepID=UPI00201F83CD|nr:zinc metalloproteinase dpy-31-like [Haliotis rufescens]